MESASAITQVRSATGLCILAGKWNNVQTELGVAQTRQMDLSWTWTRTWTAHHRIHWAFKHTLRGTRVPRN